MVRNVDSLADLKILFIEEIETRSRTITNMWYLLRIKDSRLFQSLRSKCLREDNTNFDYFHASSKVEFDTMLS